MHAMQRSSTVRTKFMDFDDYPNPKKQSTEHPINKLQAQQRRSNNQTWGTTPPPRN